MLTLGVCAGAYHPLRTPIEIDNQTFFYIAERAASGVPPHVSVVNHKQALAHLLSAAAIAAGRRFGFDDVFAGRALSIAVLAATVAGTCALALRLSASPTAAALSGLAMLTFSGLLRQGVMGFRPQLFATFFLVWTLLAFESRKNARAGAYATCAFLCWQPAAVALVGVLGANVWGERTLRRPLAVAGGAAAALAVYETYFLFEGALGEQLFQTWIMAGYGAFEGLPSAWNSVVFIVWKTARAGVATAVVPAALLAAAVVWARRARREPEAVVRLWHSRADVRAVTLTAAGAAAVTFLDHQAYPDKFFLAPFMAISAGWLMSQACDRFAASPPGRHVAACACALLLALLVVRGFGDYRVPGNGLGRQRSLAARASQLSRESSSVWVLGCLHLLALEHRANHTPVGILIDSRVRRYARALYPRLRPAPMPQVILLSRLLPAQRPRWLAREYRNRTTMPFAHERVEVWIREPSAH